MPYAITIGIRNVFRQENNRIGYSFIDTNIEY